MYEVLLEETIKKYSKKIFQANFFCYEIYSD